MSKDPTWPGRFRLIPLDAKRHAARLHPLFHGNDKEFVWDYLRDGPFPSLNAYKQHIETFKYRSDILPFVVEDVSKGVLIGKFLVIKVAQDTDEVEIAYVIFSHKVHGTGAVMAAVGMMLDLVFFRLGKAKCRWKCDKRNIRSARFAGKMGFLVEREIASDFEVKGKLRDTLVFYQSRDVWLAHRDKIMNWKGVGALHADF